MTCFRTAPQFKISLATQVGQDTLLKPPMPHGKEGVKGFQRPPSIKFSFDASYSSMEDAKPVATQTMLFDNVGRFALDNALKGYNVSMFAYGQTGTGKTHSMIGTPFQKQPNCRC